MKNYMMSFFLGIAGAMVGMWVYVHIEPSVVPVAMAQSAGRVLEAQEFRLVDTSGRLRAQLVTSNGGVALFFFDSAARNRLTIGVYAPSDQELPFISLNDVRNNTAGLLRLVGADKPYLILKAGGQDKSIFGLSADGNSFLSYTDNGATKLAFGRP